MADEHDVDLDTFNQEDEEVLDQFDEATDKELDEAGDDPAKLKEIIKARTETRQRLYARMKKAEADAKANKQDKPKDTDKSKQQKGTKTFELGYDHKAYLVANGIKGAEEFSIVQEVMQNTGKSLDDVIEMRYVQAELKALREEKATADAMPKGDKVRGGKSAQNTVDYWIAKGELPPADQVELRRKVVAEKVRQDSTGNKFGGGR